MAGGRIPISRGCKQGPPESPVSWDLILDEALGPLLGEWYRRGCGVYLLALETAPQEGAPPTGRRGRRDELQILCRRCVAG